MQSRKNIFRVNGFFIALNLFSLFTIHHSFAQDIHFSEFYASPLLVNPAKTGFITSDYRLTGIYRNQWKSITVPYNTIAGSGDMSVSLGKNKNNIIGVGLNLFNDRAGDSHLSNTQAGFSFAYHKAIDKFQMQYLGFGIQAAYVISKIDFNGLKWDEQYKGGMLTETFATNSDSYTDLSAGIEYNFLYSKNQNCNFGVAVYHINEPVNSFFNDHTSRIFQKYVFNAGISFPMGVKFTGFPKVYFVQQGAYYETILGFLARYNLNTDYKNDYGVYLGGFMRWEDAFVLTTRLDLNNLAIGLSYDVNYSRLVTVSHSAAGPELSVLYTGNIPSAHHKKIYCPRF